MLLELRKGNAGVRAVARLFLLVAFIACSDSPTGLRDPGSPKAGAVVTRIACTGDARTRQVHCAPNADSTLAASRALGDLILGGQNVFVTLASSNIAYAGDVFSFDVTVKNLIGQKLGTVDGTTLHANGVRVFFTEAPVMTGGSGVIDFVDPANGSSMVDGTATFTLSNQSYYQYSQVLATGQTSAVKRWRMHVPASVTTFSFTVYVAAEVQYSDGYVLVSPPSATLLPAQALALTGDVRDVVGRALPGEVVTWSTTAPGVATVDAAGVVTAVANGTATIKATSTVRIGVASIVVGAPPTLVSNVPANAALNVAANAPITVTFSSPVNATAASFSLECPIGTSKFFTLSAAPATTYTLTPSASLPAGESCRVTVNAAQVSDAANALTMQANAVFSFEVAPAASSDTYPQTVIGNMSINSANIPYSVTTNDGLSAGTTISAYDATSAHGGTVVMTQSGVDMGKFTYNPAAGYKGGDSFTYTLVSAGGSTATATVSLTIAGMVWYVDNTAASNGDGRLSSPFNTLPLLAAINDGVGTHPAANDNIFLYQSATPYAGPLTLLVGQRLLGQDGSVSLGAASGIGAAPSGSAAFPLMNNADGIHTVINGAGGVVMSSGSNTLRGLRLGGEVGVGTLTGAAIAGTSSGTLTVRDVGLTRGATGALLSLSNATLDIVLLHARADAGTTNVSLTNTSGSVDMGPASAGYDGADVPGLNGGSGSSITVSGGSVNLTVASTVSQVNNAPLINVVGGHTGTLTFSNTLSATNGTGLQFDNADGTYNFTGAVTLNGGDAGVDILNGSSGTFTFTSSAAIASPSGVAFAIAASNPAVTYPGTLTKSNIGRLVSVSGLSSKSVVFSGAISSTGTSSGIEVLNNTGGTVTFGNSTKTLTTGANAAVTLTTNPGATINFTNGGLAIITTSGNGLGATGGGTVNVSGTGNRVTSGSGTALSVQNTTSGGLMFDAISSTGAANGIVLVATGSGGLTVTGTGGRCDVGNTACTGGTITGAIGVNGGVPGSGVYLSNASNVSLTRMRLTGTHQNFGIFGTSVSGVTMNTLLLDGTFGTIAGEGSMAFDELTGTASLTGSTVSPASGSFGDNIRVRNSAGGTLNRLTLTADTVGFTGTNGANGLSVYGRGGITNLTVQNSVLRGGKTRTFVFTDSVSGSSDLVFSNNTVQQGTGTYGAGALSAVSLRMTQATNMTYTIAGNRWTNLNNPNGAALEFFTGFAGVGFTGSADGTITSNIFGVSGVANSGSVHNSINLETRGSGTQRVKVADNEMYQYGDHSMRAAMWGDGALHNGKLDLTFVRNTIAQPRPSAVVTAGIQTDLGIGFGDAPTMCINFGVGGLNNINNSGSTDADVPFDIISNNTSNGGFLKLLNYSGSDTGASGLAEGKVNTLFRAGITNSTFDGFLDLSQAAIITSSTNNAAGRVCNLYAP